MSLAGEVSYLIVYICFYVCFVLFLCFCSLIACFNRKTPSTNSYHAVQWLWSFVTGSYRYVSTKLPRRMALTIASLNVRGLRDNTKRREMFNWLRTKHFSMYMLQERSTALKTLITYGLQNGATTLYLATTRAIKQGYGYFSITTLIFKLERFSLTPRGASLFATPKPTKTV